MRVSEVWFQPAGIQDGLPPGTNAFVTIIFEASVEIPSSVQGAVPQVIAGKMKLRTMVLRTNDGGKPYLEFPPVPIHGSPRSVVEFNKDYLDGYLQRVVQKAWKRVVDSCSGVVDSNVQYCVAAGKQPEVKPRGTV